MSDAAMVTSTSPNARSGKFCQMQGFVQAVYWPSSNGGTSGLPSISNSTLGTPRHVPVPMCPQAESPEDHWDDIRSLSGNDIPQGALSGQPRAPVSNAPSDLNLPEPMEGVAEQAEVPTIALDGQELRSESGTDVCSVEQSARSLAPINEWLIVAIDDETERADDFKQLFENEIFPKEHERVGRDVWEVDHTVSKHVSLSLAGDDNMSGTTDTDKPAKITRVILVAPVEGATGTPSINEWNTQLHCVSDQGPDYIVPIQLRVVDESVPGSLETRKLSMSCVSGGEFITFGDEPGETSKSKDASLLVIPSRYEWFANREDELYTLGMRREADPVGTETVPSEMVLFGSLMNESGEPDRTMLNPTMSTADRPDDLHFVFENPEDYGDGWGDGSGYEDTSMGTDS